MSQNHHSFHCCQVIVEDAANFEEKEAVFEAAKQSCLLLERFLARTIAQRGV